MNSSINSSWYDKYLLPFLLDFVCGVKAVERQREKLVPLARGRVLEVGIGTGRNLPYYDPAKIEKIVGLDPAISMHRRLAKRIRTARLNVALTASSAEKIPFAQASFDTVVMTYTLCTIPHPLVALREIRRVLAPEGKLLFYEHGLAPEAKVRLQQRKFQPYWKKIAGGCHLDRDIPQLLSQAGFECPALHSQYLSLPRLLTYTYWGEARPRESTSS